MFDGLVRPKKIDEAQVENLWVAFTPLAGNSEKGAHLSMI